MSDIFNTLNASEMNAARIAKLEARIAELEKSLSIADALVDGQVDAIVELEQKLERARKWLPDHLLESSDD